MELGERCAGLIAPAFGTNPNQPERSPFASAFKVLLGTRSVMMRGQLAPVYNRFVQSEQGGNP